MTRPGVLSASALVAIGAAAVVAAYAQSSFPVRLDPPPVKLDTKAANFPGVESFRIPPFVVKDQGGAIGQAIYFERNGPVILLDDGVRRFPVVVLDTDRLMTQSGLGFTTTDCSGTAYLDRPTDRRGWHSLLGANYEFKGSGASTTLYRVLETDPVAGVTINSRWSNDNDFCGQGSMSNPIQAEELSFDVQFPLTLE